DRSERVDRVLDKLVRHARLREVAGEDGGLAIDLAGRLLGDVAVEVVDEDLRAVCDEQLRRRASDPARGARDDRSFAVEYSHVRWLSLSWLADWELYRDAP